LDGFLFWEITLKRISVLLTIPTTSPSREARTLREFFSSIRFVASSTVASLSRMRTSGIRTTPTGEERREAIVVGIEASIKMK
jgi:hypothetical protein